MLPEKEIRVPGSKEDSFFRRFYRIPCVGFSLFGWERGLVYYGLLENCGQRHFYIYVSLRVRVLYRDKTTTTY